MGMAERQYIDGMPPVVEAAYAQARTRDYIAGLEVGSALVKKANFRIEAFAQNDLTYQMWTHADAHGISNFPPTGHGIDKIGFDAFYLGRSAGVRQPIEGVVYE
jgi:hypothetical protein